MALNLVTQHYCPVLVPETQAPLLVVKQLWSRGPRGHQCPS